MWLPTLPVIVLLGLAMSACTPDPPNAPGPEPVHEPGPEPLHRALFGPGDFERAEGPFGLPFEATSYWRPTLADVAPVEVALDSALSAARAEEPRIPPDGLAGYTVQYVGVVVDGRREVYANGACGDRADLQTRWIFVMDGGTCYFSAAFDVSAGRLTELRFNGEA